MHGGSWLGFGGGFMWIFWILLIVVIVWAAKVATDVDRHQVIVRYDASQSSYQSIVEVLGKTGFSPLDSWWNRVKGNCYQFSDTNVRDNAKAPPPACCNRPPRK